MKFVSDYVQINENKTLFVFHSNELNITYISGTDNVAMSFYLRFITKAEAEQHVERFKKYINFNEEEVKTSEIDYNIICRFTTDQNYINVLKCLNDCFELGLNFEHVE